MNIQPYSKNAKKHPPEQLYRIALSIRDFGWKQPIVVDKNGIIIVGHGRWFAYEQHKETMNLPEPRIEIADDLSEEKVHAYRLADNLVASTDYDADVMLDELNQLGLPFQEMLQFDSISETKKETKDDRFINDEGYLAYLNNTVRQIVLHYDQQKYNDLIARCEELQARHGVGNNSDLFEVLVNTAHAFVADKD